jgi:uncharacterized protein
MPIFELPAIIKILSVFAFVLVLSRFKIHLSLALLAGGPLISWWAGLAWHETAGNMARALANPDLWLLLVITNLIIEYARIMAEGKNAQVILNAARAWGGSHGRAASLIAIPSAIGLVPMPGGALISAPLVAQIVPENHFTPAWKASANYWFRHTWEYWWPLYPVVIVTLSIVPMDLWQFAAMQIPVMLTVFVSGYVILIRPHQDALRKEHAAMDATPGRVRDVVAPLFIIVGFTLFLPFVLQPVWPALSSTSSKLTSMLIGLLIALALVLRGAPRGTIRSMARSMISTKTVDMMAILTSVILFESMLSRSGLLPVAGQELLQSGIPLVWVIILLPMVAGFVTGLAIGFAGLAFPLIAGLAATPETGLSLAAVMVLGFAGGYAGMMCSPIHLCFLLSRSYFNADMKRMYRYVAACSLLPLATAYGLHLFFLRVQW